MIICNTSILYIENRYLSNVLINGYTHTPLNMTLGITLNNDSTTAQQITVNMDRNNSFHNLRIDRHIKVGSIQLTIVPYSYSYGSSRQ